MKTVLLIGLGRFGRHLAMQLNALGHQVMAVDKDEERVNECMPFVTNAQIGDSTRVDFLRSLGVSNYDVCYVTISGDFQNSLETTSLLKELGANYVVSRAERDVQAKFLLRNGADAVAYRKSSGRSGRPSAIPPTIFSATLSWTSSKPLSRLPYRRTGRGTASASWTSAENTVSTSSA